MISGGSFLKPNRFTSDKLDKNQLVFYVSVNLDEMSGEVKTVKCDSNLTPKLGTAGGFSGWFSTNIALLFSGSEAEMGKGGRNLVLLCPEGSLDLPVCGAIERCIVNQVKHKTLSWIRCSNSHDGNWFHQFCVPDLKGKKLPKGRWICFLCTGALPKKKIIVRPAQK